MLKLTGETLDEEGFKHIHLEGTVDQLMDGDYVAGYEISGIARARHDDHDAIRFTLRDSQGARDVGRCVLRTDANRDVLTQFTRVFDESDRLAEFRKWLENPTPTGYVRREARQLGAGDEAMDENEAGMVATQIVKWVELIPTSSPDFVCTSIDDSDIEAEFPSGISVTVSYQNGERCQYDSKETFLVSE